MRTMGLKVLSDVWMSCPKVCLATVGTALFVGPNAISGAIGSLGRGLRMFVFLAGFKGGIFGVGCPRKRSWVDQWRQFVYIFGNARVRL